MANLALIRVYEWPLTTRILIAGLLTAVIVYIGYLFLLYPLKEELAKSQMQEKDLKEQLGLIIHKEVKLTNEVSKFNQYEYALIKIQKQLINTEHTPQLLDEILKIGASNRLYFALFTPLKEVVSNPYTQYSIKMVVVGDYHQLSTFLSQVAMMQNLVVIGDFIFSVENKEDVLGKKLAEQANSQNLLTAEITLTAYKMSEASQ